MKKFQSFQVAGPKGAGSLAGLEFATCRDCRHPSSSRRQPCCRELESWARFNLVGAKRLQLRRQNEFGAPQQRRRGSTSAVACHTRKHASASGANSRLGLTAPHKSLKGIEAPEISLRPSARVSFGASWLSSRRRGPASQRPTATSDQLTTRRIKAPAGIRVGVCSLSLAKAEASTVPLRRLTVLLVQF